MEELSQITMLEMYDEGRATLREICERFKIHRTTVWRQLNTLRQAGREGLVHKLTGRPSNRSKPAALRQKICTLFEEHYKPAGAAVLNFYEQSVKGTPFAVSYTTVRRWLKAAGLTN